MSAIIETSSGSREEIEALVKLAEENSSWVYCGMIGDTGEYFAVNRFMFTGGILRGCLDFPETYDQRWCYDTTVHAIAEVMKWMDRSWEGEPEGWHRHTPSHRRRPGGDASKEYVSP